MEKAIIMSINKPHTDNIRAKKKPIELRTKPPKLDCPFTSYIYETIANGGAGKVIGEFVCDKMTTWRICMGVPIHLVTNGCVSVSDILKYTNNGEKDLTEMHISELVIYDKPKNLSEFGLQKAPQNWCYVKVQPFEKGR